MSTYADLIEQLRLIAAWHTPGGQTPTQDMPKRHKTCTAAADAISRLEGEKGELRAALIACAGWLDGFDSSLGDFARETLSRTQEQGQ